MSGERRRNQRQPVVLEAKWESLSKRHEARVDDVSMSGCFVNTYGQVEAGERVELKVQLPSGEWLALRGHVATYQYGVGFGLAFSDLTEAEENALRELIATARKSTGDG